MDDRGDRTIDWYGESYERPDGPLPPIAPKKPREPAEEEQPPQHDPHDEPKRDARGLGVILGRFDPPHLGHVHLFEVARARGPLVVFVVGGAGDTLPLDARVDIVRELAPSARVVRIDRRDAERGLDRDDTRAFFARWAEVVRAHVASERVRSVFSSEPRVSLLADALGAEHVLVDPSREVVPVRATDIRREPMAFFRYLPPATRPWFAKRVGIVGVESTGKSRLARELARTFDTVHVPEEARVLAAAAGRALSREELVLAAERQQLAEASLAREAHRLLFCDGDARTYALWNERLHGVDPSAALAGARAYDLTILLAADVPFVGLSDRDRPRERLRMHQRLREVVTGSPGRHVLLDCARGFPARFDAACEIVRTLLVAPTPRVRDGSLFALSPRA